MKSTNPVNRRRFLQQSSAAVLGASVLNYHLRGAPGANDRIHIGVIGSGGRGSALLREILALREKQNVQITAICDVWRKNREAATMAVKQAAGHEPRQFTRFNELLALTDIDAVVIATPDFSHGPILVAALQAGKDVYIEKPMTIDIASANQALDLARAKQRVVQAGTQRRSDGMFQSAAKFIANGPLGQISRVSAAMFFNQSRWAQRFDNCHETDVDWEAFLLGQSKRPFDPRLLRCWQLFRFTSNGLPGLWMTHYADAVHMVTGTSYPNSAVSLGGIYVWKDGREHADTFHTLLDYPEGFLFDWAMGLGNSSGVHFTVHGAQGTLDLERWTFSSEPGAKPAQTGATKLSREPSTSHMENWLQCLRSRAKPNADIQFGHQHAVATIMSAVAAETGRRQKWDATRRELVPA